MAKCGLGPGRVTQRLRQVLNGTIAAYLKPSRSEDISAPWQVADNPSPERKPLLPKRPLALVALVGEETCLSTAAFPSRFGQWSQADMAAQPLLTNWGPGCVRDGAPAPEGAAVTFHIRLGPIRIALDDLQFANTFYLILQFW